MTLEAIVGIILTSIAGAASFMYKRIANRMDALQKILTGHQKEIDVRVTRPDAKEIFVDKIAPLHVSLREIQKDLDEIKQELRRR